MFFLMLDGTLKLQEKILDRTKGEIPMASGSWRNVIAYRIFCIRAWIFRRSVILQNKIQILGPMNPFLLELPMIKKEYLQRKRSFFSNTGLVTNRKLAYPSSLALVVSLKPKRPVFSYSECSVRSEISMQEGGPKTFLALRDLTKDERCL